MASASDHRAHAVLQPADCLILLPQRLPAAVETSIGPAHYPAECTQSDAFLQPSLRARYGRANSNSLSSAIKPDPSLAPGSSALSTPVMVFPVQAPRLGALLKSPLCAQSARRSRKALSAEMA